MKKSDLKEFIREEIIEILSETDSQATPDDIKNQEKLNKELEKTKELMADLNEDEEPTDADLKKSDSVAKIATKLSQTAKEMKSVVFSSSLFNFS